MQFPAISHFNYLSFFLECDTLPDRFSSELHTKNAKKEEIITEEDIRSCAPSSPLSPMSPLFPELPLDFFFNEDIQAKPSQSKEEHIKTLTPLSIRIEPSIPEKISSFLIKYKLLFQEYTAFFESRRIEYEGLIIKISNCQISTLYSSKKSKKRKFSQVYDHRTQEPSIKHAKTKKIEKMPPIAGSTVFEKGLYDPFTIDPQLSDKEKRNLCTKRWEFNRGTFIAHAYLRNLTRKGFLERYFGDVEGIWTLKKIRKNFTDAVKNSDKTDFTIIEKTWGINTKLVLSTLCKFHKVRIQGHKKEIMDIQIFLDMYDPIHFEKSITLKMGDVIASFETSAEKRKIRSQISFIPNFTPPVSSNFEVNMVYLQNRLLAVQQEYKKAIKDFIAQCNLYRSEIYKLDVSMPINNLLEI